MDVASFKVKAMGTTGRGLTPDELTDNLMSQLLYVANDAPAPIRDQARVFEERMRRAVMRAMYECARNERATVYNMLLNAGFHEAAGLFEESK